jgi:ribosomal protein L11 methyltransferase
VPYRVDVRLVCSETLDRLVGLGALDVELLLDGGIAALMPDSVDPKQVANVLGLPAVSISPAVERDAGSTWVLSPRRIRIGALQIVPARSEAEPGDVRLIEAAPFGTGLHPTTALCLEALQDLVQSTSPDAVLDVGTGSGVLALGALKLGVPRALAIDTDDEALGVAAENARINDVAGRLQLHHGGPETVTGTWPLVLANVLAAPLVEMAPTLVRRVAPRGWLVLSGIPSSAEADVDRAYRHLGMRLVRATSRADWLALVLHASW